MVHTLLLFLFLAQTHHGGQHSFEDAEKWVREFEDPQRDEWQKPVEVVRALGLKPGDRVADIGAGSGYFSRRFSRQVEQGIVYAVDIEPNMLRYIGSRSEKDRQTNIVPVLGQPGNPMLAPRSVEVVFICDTIHHVDERDLYYKTLRRALVKGGRLAIVDFRKEETPVGPPVSMRISEEDLVAELTRAGFHLKEKKDFLPHQYFLVFENPD